MQPPIGRAGARKGQGGQGLRSASVIQNPDDVVSSQRFSLRFQLFPAIRSYFQLFSGTTRRLWLLEKLMSPLCFFFVSSFFSLSLNQGHGTIPTSKGLFLFLKSRKHERVQRNGMPSFIIPLCLQQHSPRQPELCLSLSPPPRSKSLLTCCCEHCCFCFSSATNQKCRKAPGTNVFDGRDYWSLSLFTSLSLSPSLTHTHTSLSSLPLLFPPFTSPPFPPPTSPLSPPTSSLSLLHQRSRQDKTRTDLVSSPSLPLYRHLPPPPRR